MAGLDNSNVSTGNTVDASDIQQLYTALGTGSPGTIDGLVMTGSLNGNVVGNVTGDLTGDVTGDVTGSMQGTATQSNFGRVTNNITTPTSYSVVFADAPITQHYTNLFVDSGSDGSGMHYQPSTDTLQVTASYAITASHALNGGGGGGGSSLTFRVTPSSDPSFPGNSTTMHPFGGIWDPTFAPNGVDIVAIFGKTPTQFGADILATATVFDPNFASPAPAQAIGVTLDTTIPNQPLLIFYDNVGAPYNKTVSYHGWLEA
jgi:hypothetical protein